MTIIWCMVPEIWSAADMIFCHSGPFFALFLNYGPRKLKKGKKTWRYYHFTNINDSHMMYGSSEIECNRHNFFVILDCFLPFYHPKNTNLKKWKKKKTPRDIIIFHMCTTNDNHMMYGSWDMEHVTNRIFCHFGPFFALLPP